MKNILAFDVGTTAMKGILFSEDFKELYSENIEYSINTTSDGLAELDPEVYFDAFLKCINNIKEKSKDICAICFTTQGETLIPVDKDGNALKNAMVWLDTRAESQAEYLNKNISLKEFYSTTGLSGIDGTLPLAKVMWIKENEPEIYKDTYKFLLLEDYLILRLTGKFVSEKSLQSSTGWYDITDEKYYNNAFEISGLDEEKFPEVLSCGECVGNVLEDVLNKTSLNPSAKVVTGAMDQIASAIGAGNIFEGIVTETTGTALVLGATVKNPEFSLENPITVYKHFDDKFIYMPYSATAGIVLKWFRDTVAPYVKEEAKRRGVSSYSIIDEMAKKAPAGSGGVILNPDFTNGGAFLGLTLSTSANDLARSVLEGVAYMLKGLVDSVESQGVAVSEILSLGGGAYSDIWGEIKASVLEKKITQVGYNQTTALGAAILASVSLGIYESVEEAVSKIEITGKTFIPDQNDKEIYNKCYEKYRQEAKL